MKAKELIEQLKEVPEDTEVVLHNWSDEHGSRFNLLSPACSQKVEKKFILIEDFIATKVQEINTQHNE